ncbi:hypothetical protein LCGC14_0556270 [marine sediment metagenome]|uniref:Uncharacterized protein n=1 Tax=marine sediment metagenome TaxID=412755 RepID=A0A0F9RTB9_9ZZZZ
MTELNEQQKKILKDWLKKQLAEPNNNLNIYFSIEKDLPSGVFEELKEINDFETINQAIESYVVGLILDTF